MTVEERTKRVDATYRVYFHTSKNKEDYKVDYYHSPHRQNLFRDFYGVTTRASEKTAE